MNNTTFTLFLFFSISLLCWSQDGSPDLSFGNNGRVITNLTDDMVGEGFSSISQDSYGSLLAAGGSTFSTLLKYNPNGSLDTSFGTNGVVEIDYGHQSQSYTNVHVLPDDKIICAGSYGDNTNRIHFITRFLNDGSIDATFNNGDPISVFTAPDSYFTDWAFLNDGRFYLYGTVLENNNYDLILKRYLSDGSLDNSFGTNGALNLGFSNSIYSAYRTNNIKLMSDERIVLMTRISDDFGSDINYIMRLLPEGNFDNTFGVSGVVTIDLDLSDAFLAEDLLCKSPTIYANGDIAVLCTYRDFNQINYNKLLRYDSLGNIDVTFGNAGIVGAIPFNLDARELIIQQDQKLIIFGVASNSHPLGAGPSYLNRYSANGTEDNTFMFNQDSFIGYYSDMFMQDDGKIVCVGSRELSNIPEDFLLERYNNNPLSVEEFDAKSFKIYPNPSQEFITIKSTTYITDASYEIIDVNGKVVLNGILNGFNSRVNLSRIQAGVYILKTSNSNFRIVKI